MMFKADTHSIGFFKINLKKYKKTIDFLNLL